MNKKAKELLKVLKKDGIISEGEYQRMWNDYKHLHKISKSSKKTTTFNNREVEKSFKKLKKIVKENKIDVMKLFKNEKVFE